MSRNILSIFLVKLIILVSPIIIQGQTKNELYDLSIQAWGIGDFKNAELYLNEMLNLKDSLTERNKVAIYNFIGIINKDIGKYKTALEYYKKAEKSQFITQSKDYSLLSLIYNNMANVYILKGDNEKAIQFYDEALAKLKESSLTKNEKIYKLSQIYLNIGVVYIEETNYSKAISFLKNSQQIISKYSLSGLENVFVNLAIAYEELKDYQKAENYYLKSIEEWNKKKNTENIYKSAGVYNKYSSLLLKMGEKEKALGYYNKGHQIYLDNYGQRHPFTAKSYLTLGDFYLHDGQLKTALQYYQKSIISNTKQFNDPGIFSLPVLSEVLADMQFLSSLKKKSETLLFYVNSLTNNSLKIKSLKACINTIDLAIELIAIIRHGYLGKNSKLNITKEEKGFYFLAVEASLKLYELSTDEKYKKLAYSYVQKSKASLLSEEIKQNKAFTAILPDSLRQGKAEIESNIYSYKKLVFDENQKTKPDKDKINKWSHILFKLHNDYEKLILAIETEYTEYKDLMNKTNIISLENLQEKLQKDETILEYSLSPIADGQTRKLFVFIITKNALNCYQTELEQDFHEKIEYVRNQMNKKEGHIESIVKYNEFNKCLFELYNTLLSPLENQLNGDKIFIIPDEEIAYLSFDALLKNYTRENVINYASLPYLIYDYCFSYAYSSSLLFQDIPEDLKSEFVYAFAPDYDGYNLSKTRLQFGELENTENEIKSILHWFNGKALVGREANEKFFKTISGKGGIFHFAMHASSEKGDPDFSFLAITQEDANEEDGFFYNYEIAMMNMHATMVVLSGCNTGDGVISSGEGVMSLTRNFILAGAPSIVHSLWEVQDETSVVIMDKFYEYLSRGMSKNEALRQAKLNYIKNVTPTMVNPYYWSGYVLTGNPAPVVQDNSLVYSLLVILFLLVSSVSFLGIRKFRKTK